MDQYIHVGNVYNPSYLQSLFILPTYLLNGIRSLKTTGLSLLQHINLLYTGVSRSYLMYSRTSFISISHALDLRTWSRTREFRLWFSACFNPHTQHRFFSFSDVNLPHLFVYLRDFSEESFQHVTKEWLFFSLGRYLAGFGFI